MNGFIKIITAIGAVITVLGVALFATPISVYADPYVSGFSTGYMTFIIGNPQERLNGNTSDVVVPLYAKFPSASGDFTFDRFTGYIAFESVLNLFSFRNNNSTVIYSYFEPSSDNEGISLSATSNNLFNIYFDNALVYRDRSFLLGYYHFGNAVTTSSYLISSASEININAVSQMLFYGENIYGLAPTLITAINNASDIDSIIGLLNAISGIDNNVLSTLVSFRSDFDSFLSDYFPLLNNKLADIISTTTVSNTMLSKLIWALSGIDASNNFGTIADYTKERWISLIVDAMNRNNPSDTGSNSANDISVGLGNLSNGMEVAKPDNFANVSDDLISQFDTTYNASAFAWTNNSIIIMMLSTVIAIAGLSYLLYGKK